MGIIDGKIVSRTKRRQWDTGDTCRYPSCTKTLRKSGESIELGSHVGEGIIGMCSIHHRKWARDNNIRTKLVINWSKDHYCVTCNQKLRRRSVKSSEGGNTVAVGREVDGGYQCRICHQREDRRANGTKPVNRAEKSEDGLSQKCNRCGNWHTYSSAMYRTTAYGYRTTCKECDARSDRDRKDRDPVGHRLKAIKHRYGIDYLSLLSEQDGMCAICGTDTPNNGRNTFDVDHDHSCCPGHKSCGGCVRGLLCSLCNMVIGMYKEDLAVIETLYGGSKWGDSVVGYLSK